MLKPLVFFAALLALSALFALVPASPVCAQEAASIGQPQPIDESDVPHSTYQAWLRPASDGHYNSSSLNFTSPEEPLSPWRSWLSCFDVEVNSWISWGTSDRNFQIGPANVGSDLRWRNIVSEAGEVNANALICNKLVLSANVGIGNTSSYRLIDDDYLFPNRQGLFSETISPGLNDNLHYMNAEIGWRVWGQTDFLIGYQYWREKYIAQGGTQVVGTEELGTLPPGASLPAGPVLSETFTWQGPRIGFQSVLLSCSPFAVRARVMFMPVTWYENDDNHLLRQLTVIDKATGGFGVMADVVVTYRVCKGLFLTIGYRIWDVHSGSGSTNEYFADGSTFNLPLNHASTLRQGLTLGLAYEF